MYSEFNGRKIIKNSLKEFCKMFKLSAHILVPLYHCFFVFLYPCILVSLYPCNIVSLYSCILVSLYPCKIVSLYSCIVVSSYLCTLVSLFLYILVSLYSWILVSFWYCISNPDILVSFKSYILLFLYHCILVSLYPCTLLSLFFLYPCILVFLNPCILLLLYPNSAYCRAMYRKVLNGYFYHCISLSLYPSIPIRIINCIFGKEGLWERGGKIQLWNCFKKNPSVAIRELYSRRTT